MDPLDRLFVNSAELDEAQRSVLAETIIPFVQIGAENGRLYFKPAASKLSQKQKIVVVLLAQAAIASRSNGTRGASLMPHELAEITGFPGGSVRRILKELADARLITQEADGYIVPATSLEAARELLNPNSTGPARE